MRTLMMIGLLAASGAALALDAEKQALEEADLPTISDGRYTLKFQPEAVLPTSADGRFKLNSGFDPPAISVPSDGRYTLSSTLVSKVALATCGTQLPEIFRNGFEP